VATLIQAGNTVRMTCDFYNATGVLANPTTVKVIFYDTRYVKLNEFTLTDVNRSETGKYFYDYTTDNVEKRYIYEWQGIFDGYPSIIRGDFITNFM
jgi:hypothetical protein